MSAFRELVEAIQEKILDEGEAGIDPISVFVQGVSHLHLAPLLAVIERQAIDEQWDRRKLKRMMRRAGQGKRT